MIYIIFHWNLFHLQQNRQCIYSFIISRYYRVWRLREGTINFRWMWLYFVRVIRIYRLFCSITNENDSRRIVWVRWSWWDKKMIQRERGSVSGLRRGWCWFADFTQFDDVYDIPLEPILSVTKASMYMSKTPLKRIAECSRFERELSISFNVTLFRTFNSNQ